MSRNTRTQVRHEAMQEGLKTAIRVPLKVMQIGDRCWPYMEEMAKHGNMNSKSDLEVGARSLEVGIWGAYRNIVINMNDVEDEEWKRQIMDEADSMVSRAKSKVDVVLDTLDARG